MPVYVRRCLQCHQSAEHFGADIIVSGHTHDSWCSDKMRQWMCDSGKVEQRPLYLLKVPTYKDEYGVGEGGWHVETGKPRPPLGRTGSTSNSARRVALIRLERPMTTWQVIQGDCLDVLHASRRERRCGRYRSAVWD